MPTLAHNSQMLDINEASLQALNHIEAEADAHRQRLTQTLDGIRERANKLSGWLSAGAAGAFAFALNPIAVLGFSASAASGTLAVLSLIWFAGAVSLQWVAHRRFEEVLPAAPEATLAQYRHAGGDPTNDQTGGVALAIARWATIKGLPGPMKKMRQAVQDRAREISLIWNVVLGASALVAVVGYVLVRHV